MPGRPVFPARDDDPMTLSVEEASVVFDRRRRAWLAGDVDGYLDRWVEDLVLETPGRVVRGRARVRGDGARLARLGRPEILRGPSPRGRRRRGARRLDDHRRAARRTRRRSRGGG